eukprot:CAMPEP_0203920274 /NCGR_PEP_ID=MMETSP0359-20131031/60597_1 /ASSEMBLY_ACC=CAM_ASM_000338 /TAXON_ID=268821 /ORGANISM="Scrippsiella Hangoei, Strain SHTV-5" /LENGTH=103 /DNA_ID=CAMNT_0050847751 /DNA_START=6 /DNA_END=313 /DNA_ORIENTATION=+
MEPPTVEPEGVVEEAPEAEVGLDGVVEEAPKVEERQELVLFDNGTVSTAKVQSDAVSMAINYLEPSLASGVALLGPGVLVLPLLAALSSSGRHPEAAESSWRG